MLLSIAALFGLAIGSFLNVVIHRVPDGQSLIKPDSHCPRCGHAIRNRHNIPVLGWLLLRGKCADCQAPISARYPLVEAGTAALFVAVTARFGLSWELPAYLYLAAIAIALAMIDLDVRRLPHIIVQPSYAVALLLLIPVALIGDDWRALIRGLIAAAALWVFFEATNLIATLVLRQRAIGGGDLRLAPLLGFYLGWLGWDALVVGVAAGFLLGGVVGAIVMVVRRGEKRIKIPYGPFLLAGAIVAVLAATPIADWYLNLSTVSTA